MRFPVYLPLGPLLVHPHWLFESLAYLLGFRLYVHVRARVGDIVTNDQRLWIVAAAIAGAAVGSKVLYWLGDPWMTVKHWQDPFYLMAGKTIVGGLIGGVVAVEMVKRRLGIHRPTGDLFAIPLAVGIALGRIGCFLSGLDDHTYGLPTRLPWGVDFGDAIRRHPTQLYEAIYLWGLALWLRQYAAHSHREGDVFKSFMVGYLGFRLLLEFLKPGAVLMGLTAIQWACLAMLVYYRRDMPRLLPRQWQGVHAHG